LDFSSSGAFIMFTIVAFLPLSAARLEGTWNLTLLAGVKTGEIFFAHLIFSLLQCIIAIFEFLFIFAQLSEFSIFDHFWTLFLLLLVLAIACILFEFWLSCVTNSFTATFLINVGFNWMMAFICGAYW
jgi:hypothetical protein